MKLGELFEGFSILYPEDREVTHALPADSENVREDTLRFVTSAKTVRKMAGGVLLVPLGLWPIDAFTGETCVIECNDPKAVFMQALERLYPSYHEVQYKELVGGTKILRDCWEHIADRTKVNVGYGTVIGGPGFGYHNGRRFPHIGSVRLGDDVEIGSNTCIDRGSLGNTVIGARTKIDNLVHVAHNVRIGDDCQIVAGTVIGGSAVIGDRVFIGINASIKNKVRIGDDAVIGMGAVVTKDVPAGETWVGNPARKLERT